MSSNRPRILLSLVALCTAGSGLLNVYSVIGEGLATRTRLLEKIFPLEFQDFSRSLTLLVGFVLVVSSINIYRGKRRALRLVVAVSTMSIVFHLTKGLDYEEAFVSLTLITILLLTRKYFNVRSSTPSFAPAAIRAAAGFLLVLCYGVAGFLLLEEREFGFNFHLADALKHTLLVRSLVGDPKLAPQTGYAYWFGNSVYLMTFMAIAYAGLALFRPIVYRYRTLPLERLRAADLLSQYGRSSLDFFKLWPDKSYYSNDEDSCLIAYRVGNNYAVALSDPIGSEAKVEETVRGFMEFCYGNDWGVAFHQVLPDFLPIYERVGLRHLKIGDEAIVHLASFDLEGTARRNLRKTVRRFETNGYTMREYLPPIPDEILLQARSVSDDWLHLPGRRERQFSLGRFDEDYLRTTPIYLVIDASGKTVAFVNAVKSYRQGEATVDLMRHRGDAPNGTMDYLFTKLFLDCKARRFQQFSLGMAPFDGFRKSEHPAAEERAIDYLMRHLNFVFSYSGLHHFKAKFADAWEPRYLIYQNVLALPQVALALVKVSELRWTKDD
ncbi:MAG: phosphatidylglycerol lysyltransferase domain-containing protein [Pyrinomonadaceae bacterium]|nr:phosphatidylglycerol lysyltransferase domain-containing protein [Pyrinomonadaceae bacterium]